MHVLHTFANNSSVPYLTWFTQRAQKEGNVRYSFVLLYPERPAIMDEMAKLGYPCHWIKYDDNKRKRGLIKALPKMWWYIRRMRPDILHCNLFDDSLPGLLAGWMAGVRVRVVSKQETGYHWLHASRWMWFDRLITRLATDVIAISGESRQFLLEKEKAPANKVKLVHNGIPPELFTRQYPETIIALRERFGVTSEHLVIGTVARFIPWKGYRQIVEAAGAVVQRHPNARFIFCGAGDQKAAIKEQVRDAGLNGHVIFAGWVERSAMPSFYGLLDLYLHAAMLEPFGLIYPEAMMNGVPVVSTPTGAALDAIEDGKNGILVAERTGLALAEGVERLLLLDRHAIGKAGKHTALHMYSFDVMWKGTMDVYHNALDRTG